MEALTVFGQPFETRIECELTSNRPEGFGARIVYRNGHTQYATGLTEFHHLYRTDDIEPRSAFESDIHGTGFTVRVTEIETIEIFAGGVN